MALCSFIEKRRNRYYFRSRLPVDLVPVVGRTHVVISLGTPHPTTAKIRAAFCMQSLTYCTAIIRLAMRRSNDILDNSQDPVEALAREAFELGRRYATEEAALRQFYLASLEELKTIVRTTTEIDAPRTIAVAARNPSLIDPGGWRYVPPDSSLPPKVEAEVRPQVERSIGDARASCPWHDFKDEFLRDKPDLSRKTMWSYNQAFTIWKTLIGGKAIGAIRRPDLKLFADHLRDRDNPRGGKLNQKTIIRSLAHIKTFMGWAIASGLAVDDRFDAVTARSMTRAEKLDGNPRRAFTPAELDRLFTSPLFLKKFPSQADLAARWFLVIAALTGARTEEIATAPSTLVRIGDTDCLDLREAGRKTSAAPRLVPLLPALSRMGLPEWAQAQAARGYTLVQPAPQQRSASAWSKCLNRYINQHVSDDSKLVLYSLRHSFRQMLRAANIGDELADKIFGHSNDKVGAGYGRELSPDEARLFVTSMHPPVDLFFLYPGKMSRAG